MYPDIEIDESELKSDLKLDKKILLYEKMYSWSQHHYEELDFEEILDEVYNYVLTSDKIITLAELHKRFIASIKDFDYSELQLKAMITEDDRFIITNNNIIMIRNEE